MRSRILKEDREILAIYVPRFALELIDQKFLAGGLVVIGLLSANVPQALARCGMI